MALPGEPQEQSEAGRLASQSAQRLGGFLKQQVGKATAGGRRAARKMAGKAVKAAGRVAKKAVMMAVRSVIAYLISFIGIPGLLIIVVGTLFAGIFLVGGAQQQQYTVGPPTAKTKALDHQLTQTYMRDARLSRPGPPVPQSLAIQWQVPWGVLAAVDRIDVAHITVKQDTQYSAQLASALRPHLRIVDKPMVETITTTVSSQHGSSTRSSTRTLSPFPAVVYAHSWNAITHITWQLHYKTVVATSSATNKNGTTTVTTVTRIPYYAIAADSAVTNYSRLNAAIQVKPFYVLDGQADDSLIVETAMSFQGASPDWILTGMAQWLGTYTGPVPPPNVSVEQSVEFWTPQINAAAQSYHVPGAFIAAIMAAESGGNPQEQSSAGAIGLMQVMPSHFSIGQNPWNPTTNITVGTQFLASLASEFHNHWSLVAAAYNAGPGAVVQYHGIPPYPQTMAYVPEVLGYYQAFQKDASLQP